ncbi:MAG: hypothetical protein GF307_13420 [candidate division Zixibacteria bacterium]|nr:hypothetical protein [candidate division Zixibacteria bacterium]
MTKAPPTRKKPGSKPGKLLRLVIGLILFSSIFMFFASGIFPPGIAGEVLRHNQAENIDASPLLYSEVEHMQKLEQRVKQMRLEASKSRENRH